MRTHDYEWSPGIGTICKNCKLMPNHTNGNKLPFECKATAVASCCGGKGLSVWNSTVNQWECADCKSPKSNDPNYSSGKTRDEWQPPVWKKTQTTCECGSSRVGSDRHSDYCPLYKAAK